MARPTGTDGSDFQYREVIRDRYRKIAGLRAKSTKLKNVHVAAVAAKTCWYIVAVCEGAKFPSLPFAMAFVELLAIVFWDLAKVGTTKENLRRLKLCSTFFIGAITMHMLSMYQLHALWPERNYYPKLVSKFLEKRFSLAKGSYVETVTNVEVIMDVVITFALGVPCWFVHQLVLEKIAARKEQERASGGDGDGAAAALATPNSAGGGTKPSGGAHRRARRA